MRFLIFLSFMMIAPLSIAQADLDFDMDATHGRIGGYSDITYTITNISSNTITNISIDHPDAVVSNFTLSPSTIAPGASATATGRVPVSGDPVNGSSAILGSTQATVTGVLNSVTITELSDGADIQGNRVDDGITFYRIGEPQSYGFIYLDVDLDNSYTDNVDTGIGGAVINAVNSEGISIQIITNETGWWHMDPPSNVNTFMDDFMLVIDQSAFPTAVHSYNLIEGTSPFQLSLLLSFNFQYKHGYADGTASINDVQKIKTYPNPLVSNQLNTSIDTGSYELYHINGQFLESGNFENHQISFDNLNTGLHLLHIKDNINAHQQVIKIFKE